MKQRVPHYRVHYEDKGLFQLDLQRIGGNIDLIDIDVYQQDREVTTLAAARSVQRSLERRGHLVQGVYERVNIRESQEQHEEAEWEWDEEREIDD